MAFEITDRPFGRPLTPVWSPLFGSTLFLFIGLGFSSAGSLARYVPGVPHTTTALVAGFFFGLSLAAFVYALISLRSIPNRKGPVSRREWMILAPVVGLVVALLFTRAVLLFHGG